LSRPEHGRIIPLSEVNGVDDIRIPSERAFRCRERALREGLEIDRVVFDALVALRAVRITLGLRIF
jgi:LDH2 family malate/lactate/ureidoglycolate dehydrogenase